MVEAKVQELITAAIRGDVSNITALLEQGDIDIDAKDDVRRRPTAPPAPSHPCLAAAARSARTAVTALAPPSPSELSERIMGGMACMHTIMACMHISERIMGGMRTSDTRYADHANGRGGRQRPHRTVDYGRKALQRA